jgi:hypothetical protein
MSARPASLLSFPLSVVLLAAGPAYAATQIPLVLDPARSSLLIDSLGTTTFGPVALSGTLVLEFDTVPIPALTNFRVVEFEATGAGGVTLSSAGFADPGSGIGGISGGQGVLLFQTAFQVDISIPARPDVDVLFFGAPIGAFVPEPGNAGIEVLQLDLASELLFPEILALTIVAVPEPGGAALAALAALSLVARAAARRRRGRGRARRSPPSGV